MHSIFYALKHPRLRVMILMCVFLAPLLISPTPLHAFEPDIHSEITLTALRQIPVIISGRTLYFSSSAITQIQSANEEQDCIPICQKQPELHFDDEAFMVASQRLKDLKNNIVITAKNRDAWRAQRSLGAALHTVQDFYTHTNWVELGAKGIILPGRDASNAPILIDTRGLDPRLGRALIPNPSASLNTSPPNNSGVLLPDLNELTSGYFLKEGAFCSAPPGKTRHGWRACQGLNKDAPGRPGYPDAYSYALAGSIDYINLILNELAGNEAAIRALMGLPQSQPLPLPIPSANRAPTVNAGSRQIVTEPVKSVSLNGSARDDGLLSPLVTTWTGAGVRFSQANSLATVATFDGPGKYDLSLTAFDGALSSSSTVKVVINDLPVANAGADISVIDSDRNNSEVIRLNGSASTDRFDGIVRYVWSNRGKEIATGPTPRITLIPGKYTMTLIVTDSYGIRSSADSVEVVVRPIITLMPATLPDAKAGEPYAQVVSAWGSRGYVFTLTSGYLPQGLTLLNTGRITGTPTVSAANQTYAFTITATDPNLFTGSKDYTFKVTGDEDFDGVLDKRDNCRTVWNPGQENFDGDGLGDVCDGDQDNDGSPNAADCQPLNRDIYPGAREIGNDGIDQDCDGVDLIIVITLSPETLPDGTIGQAYNQLITATGGSGPYRFSLISGALPEGLLLTPTGELVGTPAYAAGNQTFGFSISATDIYGYTGSISYALKIIGGQDQYFSDTFTMNCETEYFLEYWTTTYVNETPIHTIYNLYKYNVYNPVTQIITEGGKPPRPVIESSCSGSDSFTIEVPPEDVRVTRVFFETWTTYYVDNTPISTEYRIYEGNYYNLFYFVSVAGDRPPRPDITTVVEMGFGYYRDIDTGSWCKQTAPHTYVNEASQDKQCRNECDVWVPNIDMSWVPVISTPPCP